MHNQMLNARGETDIINAHHRAIFAVAAIAAKSVDAQRRPVALFTNLPYLSAMMAVRGAPAAGACPRVALIQAQRRAVRTRTGVALGAGWL